MEIKIAHHSKQFNLNFSSTLSKNAKNESWGIKNLKIVAIYAGDNYYLITEEFSNNKFNGNADGWVLS